MIRRLIAALTVVVLAAPALALDYWPDDPNGQIYRYRSLGSGTEFDAVFAVDGDHHHVTWTHGICTGGESYLVEGSSVGLVGWSVFCQGGIDPSFNWIDPPLVIAYDEMAHGDEWVHVGVDAQGTCLVAVTVTSETVTVPMGTFETMHVHLQYIICSYPQVFDYWLDRNLGPVRIDDSELVSIEGTVVTEAQTWSEVKSLFR